MERNGSYAAMYKKQAMNYLAIENEEDDEGNDLSEPEDEEEEPQEEAEAGE